MSSEIDTEYDLTFRLTNGTERLGMVLFRDGADDATWADRTRRAFEADILTREVVSDV